MAKAYCVDSVYFWACFSPKQYDCVLCGLCHMMCDSACVGAVTVRVLFIILDTLLYSFLKEEGP